jgi:hydroxymethylbilane synthase
MNRRLNGGCQVPIACYAEITGDNQLWLRGLVGSADGKEILRAQATAERDQAEALGIEVAEALLAQGADRILAEVYDQGL